MQKEKIKFHKAKKSFGQNFLKSVLALNKIIEAGEVSENDTILEIGPGKGALTSKLLEKAGLVIAVEKDRDLLEILEEKFKEEIQKGKLILINKDILEFSMQDFNSLKYKIIANIPYNITGAILKKFLTEENQPEKMVLMVQNEVAKRIVANDKKESILSISVKAYGNPKIVMKVQKRYFSPQPKVDSAVILINNINKDLFNKENIDEKLFWEVIHLGFAHKRKVLISNLKNSNNKISPKKDLVEIFKNLGLNEKIRAEELTLENWVNIAKSIS